MIQADAASIAKQIKPFYMMLNKQASYCRRRRFLTISSYTDSTHPFVEEHKMYR